MTGSRVLLELVVVLGTAAVITVVFHALRAPVVLGYVLAGLLIGPYVPVPLVASPGLVHILSELGVILLLFTIGLELPLSTFRRVGVAAALTGLFEVAFVIVAGTLVASALGWSSITSLFIGVCLGISSTMLVAKAFEERNWKGGFTEIVFAVLVFEDLIAIVLFAVLGGVASGSGLAAPELLGLIGRLAGFLVLLLVGGLLIVPRVVRWIAKRARPETMLIVALALCFGASKTAEHAGFSVALGAFIAGILVAESGHGHDVFALVKPLRDVFAMVFFVSVGMSIEPGALATELPTIGVFAAVVILAKPIAVAAGVFLGGHGVRPAVRAGLSLAQIGELSFVIANIAVTSGIAPPSLLAIAVGVMCVTTVTSGILIQLSDPISSWVAGRLPKRVGMFVSFYEAWLQRLRSRERRMWNRLRRPVTVLLLDTGVIVTIIIATATVAPDVATDLGITGDLSRIGTIVLAAVVAVPFMIGAVRRVIVIARLLATEVIPAGDKVDLGLAPRRALIITFEMGIGLLVVVPVVAATQPFVPGGPLLIVAVVLGLVYIAWRSLRDFDGHVRAGSELILELLSQQQSKHEAPPLHDVEKMLPGFGGLATITVHASSDAVGKTLAQLDLRANTGATVLAISRDGAGIATPSPVEPLRAGDVLAMAGSDEAIAAAHAMFAPATKT